MRRAVRGPVTILVCAVVIAGASCSGDEDAAPRKTAKPPGTPTPAPRLPLTGEVATSGVPDRPVLVVKVDNTGNAEPQVGVDAADLVVEELVEGGQTRLAVMLHSTLPDVVGPVRSMRTTDIGIVGPTGGTLVASGGAGVVVRALRAAGIATVTEGAEGFSRDSGRRAPYNLMADPASVLDGLADAGGPPDTGYLPWARKAPHRPGGRAVTRAQVRFSPAHTTRWQYASGSGWTRTNGLAASGREFAADSLLVLRVTTRDAGYRDPAGNAVPETVLQGEGTALLLLGRHALEARWTKSGQADPLRFSTATGGPVRIPPGHTWIELVPEQGSVTTS